MVSIIRASDGEVVLGCVSRADALAHYDLDGCELVDLTGAALDAGVKGFSLEYSGGEMVPRLDDMRRRARDRINAEREARKDAGCATPAGFVDSDPVSRANVTGAATAAIIAQSVGAPFEIAWTLFDNSTVTLDAAATIGMSLAVLAHVTAMHDVATSLKAAIDAAETAEDIEAVVWPED